MNTFGFILLSIAGGFVFPLVVLGKQDERGSAATEPLGTLARRNLKRRVHGDFVASVLKAFGPSAACGRNQTDVLGDLYAEKPLNTEFTETLWPQC
jgi:hypothetical protein